MRGVIASDGGHFDFIAGTLMEHESIAKMHVITCMDMMMYFID